MKDCEAAQKRTNEEDEEEEQQQQPLLWSWGKGSEGQLGTGTLEDHDLPQPLLLRNFPSCSISHIACGGAHSIALTGDGRVLTWGRGTYGQLGHGELRNCLQPKLVKLLERFTISYVSAGWNHSGFVTDTGHLLMCGDGSFGQLGNGDQQSQSTPVEVPFFVSKHVEQVACGMRHSLVLVRGSPRESVYGFGSGRHGQIGLSISTTDKLRSACLPRIIEGFENHEIVHICANGDKSAALSAEGQLYTWGRGFGRSPDDHCPHVLPSCLRFSQVALGWRHALVVADGEAYMVGRHRHWELSDPCKANMERQAPLSSAQRTLDESVSSPTLERVTCVDGEKVISIAAGGEHSALVTEKGTIMTWGWGEDGQLGLGNRNDQASPQIVNIGYKGKAAGGPFRVYCGSGFTCVVKVV